ncbi:hypothetical protein HPB47_003439 [Ixodes persulcatus]|uniref:Uncharacterized protein n=1 Tax=Ixodes persulcatus TaxID=34615 RepID=A0AC60PJX8_IXOPE|nr:hypothetical protein HPB47_003439 [Ixodes persulcatus]
MAAQTAGKKNMAPKKKGRHLGPPGDQSRRETSNTTKPAPPTGSAGKRPSTDSPPHGGLEKRAAETRGKTGSWVDAVKNGNQAPRNGAPHHKGGESGLSRGFAATEARFTAFENRFPMMVNAISKLQETIPAMIAQQIAHSQRPSRRPGDPYRDVDTTLAKLCKVGDQVGRMIRRVSNKRGGLRCKDALRLAHAFVTSRVLYSTPYLHLRKFDKTALEVLLRKMYKRALDLPMNTSNQRLMGLGMRRQMGARPGTTTRTEPRPKRIWCVMHPVFPPQPTKALIFDVSCPPGASVDPFFDAATGIVGTAELFSVQHLRASNFQLSVTSSSAMSRIVNAGALSIVTVKTCLLLPVYVKSEALATALVPYGNVPDIRFVVYQDHPTLRTGTRYIRMEMKEATPVPNFLRVSGHRATFDYRGPRHVCRRCQREGHIKAACNVPYCTHCATFGHDSAGCAAGCGRCGAAHATVDCTQRRTCRVPSRVKRTRNRSRKRTPATPVAFFEQPPTSSPPTRASQPFTRISPALPEIFYPTTATMSCTGSSQVDQRQEPQENTSYAGSLFRTTTLLGPPHARIATVHAHQSRATRVTLICQSTQPASACAIERQMRSHLYDSTYSSLAGQSLDEFPALASTPRDEPPANPLPAALNAPAPTPAVSPTEPVVPSPSESIETTSPELDATTPQPTPATAMAMGEDSNAPAAMLSNVPATTILNNGKTSVPLPSSSRSEEMPVQLESPTAPQFLSSPSLNWSDLTEGSDEERLVIHETAGDTAKGVLTLNVQGLRSATKQVEVLQLARTNLNVHLLDARHCVVLGDFNCVVDSRRDLRGLGYGRSTWNARELRRLIGHFDLVDCWTLLHGATFERTWQHETLASAVQACGAVDFPLTIGHISDHWPVLAELCLAPSTGHQRFWRLDSRVLWDPTSRDRRKEVLRRSLLGVTPDPANRDHLLETWRVACVAEGRALRQWQVEELRDTSLRIRIVRRGGAGTPLVRGYLSQLLDRHQRLLRASTTAATVLQGRGGPSFHPEVLRYTHRTQVKERRVPPFPVPPLTPPPGQPSVPNFSSHFEALATSESTIDRVTLATHPFFTTSPKFYPPLAISCSSLPMQRRFTTPS